MPETYNLYNLEAPFEEYLDAGNQKAVSIKNYLSDFRHFAGWMMSTGEETSPLRGSINHKTISEYKSYLESNKIPHKTINRRLSTIRKFCSFCISQGWMKENPAKKITNINPPVGGQITNLVSDNKAFESPRLIKKIEHWFRSGLGKKKIEDGKIPTSNIQSPNSLPGLSSNFGLQHYIGFVIILIFMSVMGAGIYNQFFVKNQASLAYPTTPTKAGRILSFQGRLTDTLSNPITTATNVVFQLYSVSSGGVALYNTGTCSVTPDQDGIFSTLIGSDCGAEITASVFTENANVYLGVTVGGDAEMTPRQQIANVGYAINSETLQGLPPGTGTSVIPYINVDGNLLISASAPGIRSTSASTDFTLSSAKATVIQSAGTGDIVLQATESGTLKFRTGGITDAYTRIAVDNLGNVGIGTTAPAQKLDVAGTAQMTGFKMTTSPSAGYILTSDATGVGSWADVSSTAGPWTLSGVNLYPDSTAYNVGIGTTAPGAYKLNVNGNSNVTGTLNVTTSVSSPTFQGIGAAVTFGNASYGTTIAGSGLTVSPTAWTATPTISGLTTMTSGFASNAPSTITANTLTSNNALAISSTATGLTTGGLLSLDWSPGSALTATGDLLSLNIGANGNIGNLFNVKDTGSSLFSVSETAVTSNLPTSFTSSGDVSIAYDLNFTNPTASYIKSSAPFYIQAGETFGSSDLTLQTYNSGDVVIDSPGGVTLNQAQAWDLADSSTTSLNIESGLMNFDTTNSRVGIGTTSPLAKLHVEGSCVTGDTLLPIRRKKKRRKSKEFSGDGDEDDDEFDYLLCRIDEIQPGDEVLSLNEFTEALEYARINKLMDMGVKPIFRLTTEDGRTIRTTGNHPYLVQQKESSSINQSDSGFSQNSQSTSQISTGLDRHQKGQNDLNNFTFAHLSNQDNNNSMTFADTKAENVTKTSVKAQQDLFLLASETENGIVISPRKSSFSDSQNIKTVFAQTQNNIGVDTLISQDVEDHSLSGADFQNFLFSQDSAGEAESNFDIGNRDSIILSGNIRKTVSSLQKIQNIGNGNSCTFNTGLAEPDGLLNNNSRGRGSFNKIIHENDYNNSTDKMSSSRWTKVIYIKIGDEIAVQNGETIAWQKIKSIEELPAEQVYDIEVEGTHNFVGNGIVAHNTYIMSGNVGIGTTAPANKLDVAGTAQMTGIKMTTSPSAGYILTSDATGVGSWADVSSTAGPWTLSGVNLYPDSTSYNVGIGTTAPLSKLGVLGNLSVGATYGAIAAPTSGAIFEGNVGIGTTAPLQKLHVEGQCVAMGTLIRRRKKKKRGDGDEDEWEDVPVEDIKPGDEVLTLNEESGGFEWQEVEEIMDMGIQEAYELITESGKKIETTANHPYLTRGFPGVVELDSNSNEGPRNQNQSGGDLSAGNYSYKFIVIHNESLSKTTANNMKNIANKNDFVNKKISTFGIKGVPNNSKIQAAAMFPDIPEAVLNTEGFIFSTLLENNLGVNGVWKKVSYLKVGDKIATLDGFEKITSIKITKRQQMYDLQIANTHNFVAGHYVDKKIGKTLKPEEEKALISYLATGGSFFREFSQKDEKEQNSNQSQSQTNVHFGSKVSKINHKVSKSSSILTANNINNIPITNDTVNTQKFLTVNGRKSVPEPILTKTVEKILSWADRNSTFGNIEISVEDFKNLVNRYKKGEIMYGGIVAHNTYISGNVGIGTTGPGAKLGFAAATTAAGGIDFGGDVTLYRGAANELRTDDILESVRANTTDLAFVTWVTGDSNNRWYVRADGTMLWGPGNASVDTNLYRGAANVLQTDDGLNVAGNVGIGTTVPTSKLHVDGAVTGKALAIFNETGDQNILTASQSGIPVFNLARVAGTAANGTTFTPSATGNAVTQAATGSDTNIAYSLDAKGTGALNLNNTGTGDILLGGGSGSTGCTVANSTGNLTCAGVISGSGITASALKWNALTVPDGNLTLAMDADTTTFNWDTLTTGTGWTGASTSLSSGTLESLSVNSTAATGNTQKVLSLSTAGANATSTQTTYGLYATNTHTGTASTNVGGYFSASGGTNNYAAIFDAGNVGIGTTTPGAKLHISGGNILLDNNYSLQAKDVGGTIRSLITYGSEASPVLYIDNPGTASEIRIGNSNAGTLRLGTGGSTVLLDALTASAGTPLRDTAPLTMRTRYWNGSASTAYDASIQHVVTATTPVSRLAFTVGTTEGLSILNNGNVGIGTTGPGAKLEVHNSDADAILSRLTSTYGTTNNYLGFASPAIGGQTNDLAYLKWTRDSSQGRKFSVVTSNTAGTSTEGFTVDYTGNVGIGTTGPGYKLDVNGTFNAGTSNFGGNVQHNEFSLLFNQSGVRSWTMGTAASSGNLTLASGDEAGIFRILTTSTLVNGVLTVSGTGNSSIAGNVGIGTTSPTRELTIDGTAPVTEIRSGGYLMLRPTANNWDMRLQALANNKLGVFSGGDLVNPIMTFVHAGNVGIGTVGPTAKLDVNGSVNGQIANFIGNSNGVYPDLGVGFVIGQNFSASNNEVDIWNSISPSVFANTGIRFLQQTGASSYTDIMFLANSGNVGIGTTSPANKLDVAGTAQMTGIKMTTSPSAGYILTSDATGVGSWADVSSTAGPWTLSGSNLYPDSTAYNVGIGTTAPGAYKLNVNGNSNVTGTLNVTTSVSSPIFQGIGAAVTFGNASYGTTIAGSGLTVSPTAWTATPTISGLVTMTSGFDSNTASTVTALTIDGTAGTGDLTINSGETSFTSPATTANANIFYGNSLTSGNLLYLSSTSTALTTGSLASLDWSPGSALTATGDLLSLNIGANGNIGNLFNVKDTGSSLFSVSETAVTSNLPTSFTSSGDVSIAYDLNFTNPTASYIKSAAPFYIQAGETFNSSDLNLKTYNSGDVVLDAGGSTTGTGTVKFYDSNVKGATDTTPIGFAAASSDVNNFRTNYTNENIIGAFNEVYGMAAGSSGGIWTDAGTYIYPTTAGATAMSILDNGNVGIGTTSPGASLDIVSPAAGGSVFRASSGISGYTQQNVTVSQYGVLNLNNGAGSQMALNSTSIMSGNAGNTITIGSGGNLYLQTYNAGFQTRMTLDTSGNVGIGTTEPAGKLHVIAGFTFAASSILTTSDYVASTTGSALQLSFGAATGSTYSQIRALITGGGAVGNLVFNPTGGNVGIGTTSPGAKLDVTGGNILLGNNYALVAKDTAAGLHNLVTLDSSNVAIFGEVNAGGVPLETRINAASIATPITFYQGTGEKMRINTGNVGIGTTGPAQKLHVYGNGAVAQVLVDTSSGSFDPSFALTTIGAITTEGLKIWYDASVGSSYFDSILNATNSDLHFRTKTAGTPIEALFIKSDGNVGIGTTGPGYKLHVKGSGSERIEIETTGASQTAGIFMKSTTASGSTIRDNAGVTEFYTGGSSETFTMALNSGNVGIGTTGPVRLLSVENNGSVGIGESATSGNNPTIYLGGYVTALGVRKSEIQTDASGNLQATTWNGINLFVNGTSGTPGTGTQAVTILNSGNVGIGTTAPTENKLDVRGGGITTATTDYVSGSVGSKISMQMNATTGNVPGFLQAYTVGATAYGNIALNPNGGNVGIGTTAPAYKLDVNGSVRGDIYYDSSSVSYYLDPANSGTSLNTAGDVVIAAGAGKLDVGTVDPPYTINGKKYATYLPSMTGVKEETTGIVTTTQLPMINNQSSNIYGYTIDFSNEPEASDLWLFAKVTDLKRQIDQMTVLLTPSENTRSWYKIDKENYRLTIYSSRPTNISYRLTAPRFDSDKWANVRDQNDPVPGLVINDQGEVTNPSPSVAINKAKLSDQSDFIYNGNLDDFKQANSLYKLTGDFIEEFISINEALIARIKAGFIEVENIIVNNTLIAKNIAVDNIQIAGKNINQLIDERINLIISTGLINQTPTSINSPIIETDKVVTNEIKPANGDLTIDLSSPVIPSPDRSRGQAPEGIQNVLDPRLHGDDNGVEKGGLARLIIKGLEGKTVTTIDSEGNASFSGQIIADSLKINTDATVAGTLAAKEIKSENIDKISNDVRTGLDLSLQNTTNINDIQALLADIKNQPIPDPNYYQNLDSSVIPVETGIQESLDSLLRGNDVFDSLTVTGQSNLYNVSVSNSLLVGTTLFDQNSIISLASELKLSALAKINLFDGAVIIAKDGKITTRGEIIAKGGIRTDEIKPLTDDGQVSIKNLTINNLTIDKISTNSAIIAAPDNFAQNGIFAPAIEAATASAGLGILPANQSEVIIYNDHVSADSLVYLTPTSDAPTNSSLTVGEKSTGAKPYFKVISQPSTVPVKFNWLIVN